MKRQPNERAVILGEYILEQNATVRAAAEWFGISKSTVHKDVSERLPFLNPNLYDGVKAVLEKNLTAGVQYRCRRTSKIWDLHWFSLVRAIGICHRRQKNS